MSGADRLKGVLLLRQVTRDASQAEVCFHQVLDIARPMGQLNSPVWGQDATRVED